jgi:hypothetical protein
MRHNLLVFLLSFVTLITGCDWCVVNPNLCAIPPEEGEPPPEEEEALPPDAGAPVAPVLSGLTYTWSREGDAFAEQTAEVQLLAECVDENEAFLFAVFSQNYSGEEEIGALESIELQIEFGDRSNEVSDCYVLISQNGQPLPDPTTPNPGSGSYVVADIFHEAPIVESGPFTGYRHIDVAQAREEAAQSP